jgi:hypothetical protein
MAKAKQLTAGIGHVFLLLALPMAGIAQDSRGIMVSGERTALVIGNSAYRAAPLQNPVNDAEDMAELLSTLQFKVTLKKNVDRRAFEESIRHFGRQLSNGGVGLFYFAGHGMQVEGRNYLVPVDARIESESDVRYEAVDAGYILGKMEDARNHLNLVILDACRNNPFSRNFRSAERGLARMDAPAGSLIVYATAPGEVAADGHERNGIFTKYLIRHMQTPNIPVEQVLKRARIDVAAETKQRQIPWESSSLMGDFYFKSGNELNSAKRKSEDLEKASIHSKDPVLPNNTKRHEVAIFPAFEEYRAGAWLNKIDGIDRFLIDSLQKTLTERPNFNPAYSYYDLGSRFRSKKIPEDFMTEKVQSKLWQKKLLSVYQQPNIELICELGRKLNVDAVMTFWIYYDQRDQMVHAFFVDINRKIVIEALEKSDDGRGTTVSSAHRDAMATKIKKVTSEVFEKVEASR